MTHVLVLAQGEGSLVLEGEFTDEQPPSTFSAKAALVLRAGQEVLRVEFKQTDLPAWCIDGNNSLSPARVQQHLAPLSNAARASAQAQLLDAVRRIESVNVDWTTQGNQFFGLACQAKGGARLMLASWLLNGQHNVPIAEFFVRVVGHASANQEATVTFTCVLTTTTRPRLRLDCDDFNFSLPEFDFPTLNLGVLTQLQLPPVNGAARLFDRLSAGAVTVTIENIPATDPAPLLVIHPNNGTIRWALVKYDTHNDQIDWTSRATLSPVLATFKITATTTAADPVFDVQNVRLGGIDAELIIEGTASAQATVLNDSKERKGQLGPIAYRLQGLTVTAVASLASEFAVTATLTFDRLELRLADDPQVVLAFKGTVQLTPSGSRIESLSLIDPYPIALVAAGAQALARGAHAVATFLASLDGLDVNQLKALLAILGKFAAAVARAALMVGTAIVGAAAEAASLAAQALTALADALKAILARIGDLLANESSGLNVEVRIALDPMEIRQILVTQRTAPTSQSAVITGGGLELYIHGQWMPGVLLDFVDNPGAYLIATRCADGPAEDESFATLGTDLWLAKNEDKSVSHMPDAAPSDGAREKTRVIQLAAKLRGDKSKELVLIVAGLSRGQPVFLQRLKSKLTSTGAAGLMVVDGEFEMEPMGKSLDVGVDFQANRLLPLLGMGETGTPETPPDPTSNSFLDKLKQGLGQVVWVERTGKMKFHPEDPSDGPAITGDIDLGVKAAGISTTVNLALTLTLKDMAVRLKGGDNLALKSRRIEEHALGLTWVVEQKNEEARTSDAEVEMFRLSFSGDESGFGLNTDNAKMELRFGGLSSDGEGVVFEVTEFFVGRRGVDITAKVSDRSVRLNGLDVPFRFQTGGLKIRAGRLIEAAISGRGTLPPALVGEADCTLALAFTQDDSGIVLQSGKVEIDKKGEPIVCHSTRFTLTISDLDVGIQKDNGYHFYFLVTGSLRFTPKPGEFESGLLGFLNEIEITLERTPLTGDARVLAKHISFQKALNPKKSFPLFNLFTFELRGFGFHPSSPRFDGQPAINLSGQIKFATIGDVMQPKIDFHGLWIAAPKDGESLPRISAEGLGVDLQLSGAIKVRGSVLAVDPQTRTVEGKEFAPAGYNTYGFLGEGEVDIPGWGSLQASLGFLEIESKLTGERKKAFFVYLQKDKLAVEIPTGFWTFYLREAGFGFGFRYTLAGIKGVDEAKSPAQLIRILDDASKRQGDLSRYEAWSPDPEGDRFTLALRGALQAYPANDVYKQEEEEVAENPFFFDLILAIRSDLTLLASMRGYLGVNYADFRANKDNFRERPGLRGYLYISAPRSELLARMIGDSKGFIGERFDGLKEGQILRQAIQSVDWSSTLYIRPGLFHYELGWPDQLAVRLVDTDKMKVTLRGGMIFRAADDGLLWGYNIEADAWLKFGGSAGRSIGAAVEASLQARLVARLLAFLSWQVKNSLVYALVSLDACLVFRVSAWMEVDLGFRSFTIPLSFSISLQFTAVVELAIVDTKVGGRVQARIAVSVFGCSLGVSVGFAFDDGTLDAARQRVQRFMAMSLTAEQPDSPPAITSAQADERADSQAQQQEKKENPTNPPTNQPAQQPDLKPSITFAKGRPIGKTDFWLVLYETAPPDGETKPYAYALLVPKEPTTDEGGFYGSPALNLLNPAAATAHVLHIEDPALIPNVSRITADGGRVSLTKDEHGQPINPVDVAVQWQRCIPVDGDVKFTLSHLFDECFLTDTHWERLPSGTPVRVADRRQEPLRPWRTTLNSAKVNTADPEKRKLAREQAQQWHAADAANHPSDDRVYQVRASVLNMFIDQFVAFAKTGVRSNLIDAHVLDLGLVFYGPADELEKLATLKVEKRVDAPGVPGFVHVLNPAASWFERQDPVFAHTRQDVAANGVRLAWDLSLPWPEAEKAAPRAAQDHDHFLQYYEIVRTVEGQEFQPRTLLVKPAATIGQRVGEAVELLPPDWQFTDDLSDLGTEVQRALLPSSDEEGAMQSAVAWLHAQLDDDVTLTYSVTPVDIAGTRGLSKSFSVTIDRPIPPVRAAEAEIRIVQTFETKKDSKQYAHEGQMFANAPGAGIQIYVGMRDGAWKETAPNKSAPTPEFTLERAYSLVVEQEITLPAGSYGSDGLTDKIRGLGSAGAEVALNGAPTNRQVYRLKFKDFDPLNSDDIEPTEFQQHIREEIEPDKATRDRLNLWALLCGASQNGKEPALKGDDPALLQSVLWSTIGNSQPERVATRFWLQTETVISRTLATGRVQKYELKSKLVPAAVELTVVHKQPTGKKDEVHLSRAVLRPDAFEWPVHLRLPPLTRGQVRVKTGFMHLRAPDQAATLGKWHAASQDAVKALRDPDRRTMATIEFDAVPLWDPSIVQPIHGSSIAGFDVHALDIDELAPMDSDSKRAKKDAELRLGNDANAWQRARRVAHVELLSPEAASLVPSSNADWLGWQAHYPSETLRVDRSTTTTPTQGALPMRRGWYSERESTPHFAERIPRLRLLTEPMDSAVSDLMQYGQPRKLTAHLRAVAESDAAKSMAAVRAKLEEITLFTAHLAASGTDDAAPPFVVTDGFFTRGIDEKGLRPFSAADLRYFLLSLCWLPLRAIEAIQLAGLELVIESLNDVDKSTTVVIPLDFSSRLHPLLEEVISELSLSTRADTRDAAERTTPQAYRKYAVMVQPVQPLDAREFSNYLAGSAAATDPYGWGVLQKLGLASTIRLFDIAQGTFVQPRELAKLVDNTFRHVRNRWQAALATADDARLIMGQPFAEVLLKPGADRVTRPFDGQAHEAVVSGKIDVNADGLAMMQISLRPTPAQPWGYLSSALAWPDQKSLNLSKTVTTAPTTYGDAVITKVRRLRIATLELYLDGVALTSPVDVLLLPTLATAAMDDKSTQASMALQIPLPSNDKQALSLFIRRPATLSLEMCKEHIKARFKLVVETSTTTDTPQADDKQTTTNAVSLETKEIDAPLKLCDVTDPTEGDVTPFSLFSEQSVDMWSEAMNHTDKTTGVGIAASRAFNSLLMHLRAVAPDLKPPKQDAKTYATFVPQYLQWSQRFLDHGAVPTPAKGAIALALAAPIKSTPWRLAPDNAGSLTLNIPVDDKWGHAVAYAVKPLSRYANLMAGVEVMPSIEREQLITPDVKALAEGGAGIGRDIVGCAIAVMPRTERIEPPVILGSSIQDGAWEVALARHGEESLVSSNRPLFARLGKPQALMSQLRSYRTPDWPTNLSRVLHGEAPQPEPYPARAGQHARRPQWAAIAQLDPSATSASDQLRPLSQGRLNKLAHDIPGLWKGAEVTTWRPVPPQYKVLALAAARAGIVVSNLSSVMQEDLPRKSLHREAEQPSDLLPTLSLELNGSNSELVLRHRLISHHDLTPDNTRAWNENTGNTDICWWPDPNVTYNLVRFLSIGGKTEQEEIAEIHLRAEPEAKDEPFVVRSRGSRWRQSPTPGIGVEYRLDGDGHPLFELRTSYQIAPEGPSGPQTTLSLSDDDATDPNLTTFKLATTRFSIVMNPRQRDYRLAALVETDAACDDRLTKYLQACKDLKDSLDKRKAQFDVSALLTDCDQLISILEPWLSANAGKAGSAAAFAQTLATDKAWAFARGQAKRYWPMDEKDVMPGSLMVQEHDGNDLMLSIWDLPAEVEIPSIQASQHPLGQAGSRFWQAVVERMTGGSRQLQLRAVDGRAPLPRSGLPDVTNPSIDAAFIGWPSGVMQML